MEEGMDHRAIPGESEQIPVANSNELDSLPNPLPTNNQGTTDDQHSQNLANLPSPTPKLSGISPNMTPAQYLENMPPISDTNGSTPEDDEMFENSLQEQSQESDVPFKELRTGLCYDARMRFHVELMTNDVNSAFHPEDPRRIIAIYSLLGQNGLIENSPYMPSTGAVTNPLQRIPARYATKEECCRVHTERHFDDLRDTAEASDDALFRKSMAGDSVYYNQSTYSTALLAAGSAIDTTLAVVKGVVKNAIAVIRPPGHHSESDSSQGFCHFDNVAVAVRNAQYRNSKIQKVLIVDWDVHHGNGIQEAFEDDPNVLYISLHVYRNGTFYPLGTAGSIPRDGVGKGVGKNINIAWEDQGRTDGDYLMAFQHIIMPVAHEFNPDLVMIASGFDAAEGDQLGGCHVSPNCYSQMTHMLMSLADGKVVVCLEGGYNLKSISISALAVTKTLMGQAPLRVEDAVATRSGAKTVFDVIRHHQQYWKSLVPKDKSTHFDAIAEATRLHDIVRCVQADQLFKDHRMFQLPVFRERSKQVRSKSFENQIIASPNFRTAQELLLIFHEQPQLAGSANPVTGDISLSSPKVIDSALPYIHWAINKGFGVIDVNLPDFYTGISKDDGDRVEQSNKHIANTQMQIISSFVWDNYVATAAAKKVVILGLGNAFFAAQRIIATHPAEAFQPNGQSIRAIGVIEGDVPGGYQEPLLHHYDYYYYDWTKIWVPKSNKIFSDLKNGHPRKKYGRIEGSIYDTLNNMLKFHEKVIKSEILTHFKRSPEPSSSEESDEDGQGKSSSQSSSKSALGKRARESVEDESKPSRARVSEER